MVNVSPDLTIKTKYPYWVFLLVWGPAVWFVFFGSQSDLELIRNLKGIDQDYLAYLLTLLTVVVGVIGLKLQKVIGRFNHKGQRIDIELHGKLHNSFDLDSLRVTIFAHKYNIGSSSTPEKKIRFSQPGKRSFSVSVSQIDMYALMKFLERDLGLRSISREVRDYSWVLLFSCLGAIFSFFLLLKIL